LNRSSSASPGTRKRLLFSPASLVSAAIAVVLAMAFATSARSETKSPISPDNGLGRPVPPQIDYLPPLLLVDQFGKPVTLSSVKGKPVLIGFIHTSCKGICEMMTAKMKQVAQSLGSQFNSSVTMVSITTDPDEDGPSELLKYAKTQGVDASGFLFLTGRTQQIDGLLKLYDVPEEGPDEATTHVLDLFLVAPDGSGMRKYDGMKVSPDTLASAIKGADTRH
jgi:cytochrome oxidase Cu insertion factor (SCO1/SenC/PrrC family)